MNSARIFDAYRRMFATQDDGDVCWWYSGWSFAQPAGYPEIPLSQVVAIMTFRTRTLSGGERMRIDWSEIGIFRDPVTGGLPGTWLNPVTGRQVELPRSFREGPGTYLAAPAPNSVTLALEQPHARVMELGVEFHADRDRIWFLQRERKIRGYPREDGSLPPPDSPSGFESVTELAFFAGRVDVDRGGFVPALGTYTFRLGGLPPSLGFGDCTGAVTTRGCITKARPGEIIDRESTRRLAAEFPEDAGAFSASRA